MRPSSVRAPLPEGVLTIAAMVPLARWSSRFGRPSAIFRTGVTAIPCSARAATVPVGPHQGEAERRQPRGDRDDGGLVAGRDAEEDRPDLVGSTELAAIWLLAKAAGKSWAIPITSPVDRISGPRTMSTPGNLANGKTLSLTATNGRRRPRRTPCSASVCPTITLAATLAHGSGPWPWTRTAPSGGPRVDLQDVDLAVLDGELDVHQAADAERLGQRDGLPLQLGDDLRRRARTAGWRTRSRREWMPASSMCSITPADRLPWPARRRRSACATSTSRASVEELVDQDRGVRGAGVDGRGHVVVQLLLVGDDLHGPAAEDEAGADEDGVADPCGDPRASATLRAMPLSGCLRPRRSADRRNCSRSPAASRLSMLRAEDRHPGLGQRPGQVQRGLAAELDDDARPAAASDPKVPVDRSQRSARPRG